MADYLSVRLTPAAKAALQQLTLEESVKAGQRLSMSAVLLNALHIATLHRGEFDSLFSDDSGVTK